MKRAKLAIAIVAVTTLAWLAPSEVIAKRRGNPGQWNIAGGICGTVVDLATQLTTGHVYAAVRSWNLHCAGVYRSTDGGANFRKVGIDFPGYSPPTIFGVSGGAGSTIYAATSAGVWKTNSTTLVTWTRHFDGFPANEYGVVLGWIYMVDAVPGTFEVYATFDPEVNGGGLYRSTDGGDSWALVQPGLDAVRVTRTTQCGIEGNSTVFAAARADRGGLPGGLWISRDGGLTWAASSAWNTDRAMDVGVNCGRVKGNGKATLSVFVTNGDPTVNASVFRSDDLGLSFAADNQGIPTCCASTIRNDRFITDLGGFQVGTWAESFNGGDGMYTRSAGSRLGASWSKFSDYGLPPGAPIDDWVEVRDTVTGEFQFVAIVNGGVYFHR